MAQLDRFIQAMHARRAASLTLASGQQPTLLVNGRAVPIMEQRPTPAQIRRLLLDSTPAAVRAQLLETGRGSFDYAPPGGQAALIEIRDWTADTVVMIRPRPERTPPQPAPGDELDAIPAALRSTREQGPATLSEPTQRGSRQQAPAEIELDRGRDSAPRGAAAPGGEPPINRYFRKLVAAGASDLHLSADEVPILRKDGDMGRLEGERRLSGEELFTLLEPIMPEANREQFQREDDTDFAYEIEGLARFRANMFRDRKGPGAVFRTIPAEILTAEKLGLPEAITSMCQLHKGLVLVTGPTGSGKSTTLCAMVDLINRTRAAHIITIEDPIEFVHENKKCLINQREVGPHTQSFKRALRAALREDPDVVLVGEMRDLETIAIAIETAETGHLVFGTLHTTTAYSTIDRIIDQYPPDQQEQIRVMLSEALKGVVSQTLCKKVGGGRVAALEILIVNPAVSNLIREGKTFQIPSVMQTGKKAGMRLLNDALLEHVVARRVMADEALSKAVDKTSLTQMMKNAGVLKE